MKEIDEIYTQYPFYGRRRMTVVLRERGHEIYPYLLRNLVISRVHQVWSTDITFIRLPQGFMYLTAIIDWYSRYVLS